MVWLGFFDSIQIANLIQTNPKVQFGRVDRVNSTHYSSLLIAGWLYKAIGSNFCGYILMAQVILNTDEMKYGGQGCIKEDHYIQKTVGRR